MSKNEFYTALSRCTTIDNVYLNYQEIIDYYFNQDEFYDPI